MKKFLLMAIILIAFGINAYAEGKNYKVTVIVERTIVHYDKGGNYLGEKSLGTIEEKFRLYAETPNQARQLAISQCSTACSNGGGIVKKGAYQGPSTYNGQESEVYEVRNVVDTLVE